MATKRTEDMTVAEAMDAIFGDGFADKAFTPEELEIAGQSFKPTCESPFVNAAVNKPATTDDDISQNFTLSMAFRSNSES